MENRRHLSNQNFSREFSVRDGFGGRGRQSRKNFKKFKPIFILVTVLVLASVIWSFLSSSSSVFNFAFNSIAGGPSFKSTDDRVNILLLGVGGEGHEGPYLTDSIIVASYNLKTKKATLISIPRDLWLKDPGEKINQVYAVGMAKGNGLGLAEDKIDNILGFPIHYGVRIDFSGFAKAIDLIGGVEIDVARTFDDYMYPVEGKENDLCDNSEQTVTLTEDQIKQLNLPADQKDFKPNEPKKVIVDKEGKVATDSAKLDFGCRFEHIHYDKGVTQMDGVTALKFVRSRHALGSEGSDFARSKRQQLVIEAFREKALSLETIANPQKMASLISTLGKSVDTDIPVSSYLDFYNLSKQEVSTESIVLGDLGNGKSLLINPPPSDYGGAWVLIPPNNDFTQIQMFIMDKLEGLPSPIPSASGSPGKK